MLSISVNHIVVEFNKIYRRRTSVSQKQTLSIVFLRSITITKALRLPNIHNNIAFVYLIRPLTHHTAVKLVVSGYIERRIRLIILSGKRR